MFTYDISIFKRCHWSVHVLGNFSFPRFLIKWNWISGNRWYHKNIPIKHLLFKVYREGQPCCCSQMMEYVYFWKRVLFFCNTKVPPAQYMNMPWICLWIHHRYTQKSLTGQPFLLILYHICILNSPCAILDRRILFVSLESLWNLQPFLFSLITFIAWEYSSYWGKLLESVPKRVPGWKIGQYSIYQGKKNKTTSNMTIRANASMKDIKFVTTKGKIILE